MKRKILAAALLAGTALSGLSPAFAGEAPYGTSAPNIPVNSHHRVYAGDQFSKAGSVVDPSGSKTLGIIPLGDPSPVNLQMAPTSPVGAH